MADLAAGGVCRSQRLAYAPLSEFASTTSLPTQRPVMSYRSTCHARQALWHGFNVALEPCGCKQRSEDCPLDHRGARDWMGTVAHRKVLGSHNRTHFFLYCTYVPLHLLCDQGKVKTRNIAARTTNSTS